MVERKVISNFYIFSQRFCKLNLQARVNDKQHELHTKERKLNCTIYLPLFDPHHTSMINLITEPRPKIRNPSLESLSARTSKSLLHHILLISQHQSTIIFKAILRQTPKAPILYAQYAYDKLPTTLQVNFTNIPQIIEDIKLLPNNRVFFRQNNPNILTLQLQVGSKLKDCNFRLESQPWTYQEEIQFLLYALEEEKQAVQKHTAKQEEVQKLKTIIQRQSKEIVEMSRRNEKIVSQFDSIKEQNLKMKAEYLSLLEQFQKIKQNQNIFNSQPIQNKDSMSVQTQQKLNEFAYELTRMTTFEKQITELTNQVSQLKSKMGQREYIKCENEKNQKDQTRGQNDNEKKGQNVIEIEISEEEETAPVLKKLKKKGKQVTQQKQDKQDKPDKPSSSSMSSQQYTVFQKFFFDQKAVTQSQPSSFYRTNQRFRLLPNLSQTSKTLTSLHSIPLRSKTTLRLIHTKQHLIWFGLMLSQRINKPSTKRHPGAISYKLKGGKQLCQNGVQSGVNVDKIFPNDQIGLEWDGIGKKMRWIKKSLGKEKVVCQRAIPVEFRKKEMFPFVTMVDQGDQVEFV